MSWFKGWFGSAVAEPIEAITGLVDELHTSREEKDAARIVIEKLRQEPARLQAVIGMIQAQHRSFFVAGGRPFIIWVCGWTLAYLWPIRLFISDMAYLTGASALPETSIGAADVVALLGPILGLGAMRTGEKLAGKAR